MAQRERLATVGVRQVRLTGSQDAPVTRAALVLWCQERLGDSNPFWSWSVSTWERRVRDATRALRFHVPPLVNRGHGYYFAETREDLEAGTRRDRRMAFRLLQSVSMATRSSLADTARQLEIEFGGEAM